VLKFSDGRPDDVIDIIINIIIDFDMIVLWSSQEFGQTILSECSLVKALHVSCHADRYLGLLIGQC